MSSYVWFFVLIFLAVVVAVWISPPFGKFALSDS